MPRSITWDDDTPKQQGRSITWDTPKRDETPWWAKSPVQLAAGAVWDRVNPETAPAAAQRDLSRLSILPQAVEHGFSMATTDERDAMRAARGQTFMGRAQNFLHDIAPIGPAFDLADGAAGVLIDTFLPEERKGDAFTSARDETRANITDMRQRHPVTSFAGETAGGLAVPGLGGGKTIVSTALRGAASGAGLGYIYGFNEGEAGNRTESGLTGAATGGTLGGALGGILGAFSRQGARSQIPGGVLDATPDASQIPQSSRRAFNQILLQAGLSGDDINALFMRVDEAIQAGESPTIFARLVTEALEPSNPQAADDIRRVWRQLQLEASSKSDSGQVLRTAIDDQKRGQSQIIDDTLDDVLGDQSIADEFARLNAEREAVGQVRNANIATAQTNRANAPQRAAIVDFANDVSAADTGAQQALAEAARRLGYPIRGRGEEAVRAALAERPIELMVRFQTVINEDRAASPFLKGARERAQALIDDASRLGNRDGGRFTPRVSDEVAPDAARRLEFRRGYSQEEAIEAARGQLAKARDPLSAQQFAEWFRALPSGEQAVVRTVIKNDIGRMIRGGNFSDDLPWLTNIDKRGVHETLVEVLGEDGVRLSRFLDDMRREGQWLNNIDPRPNNGQPRYELSARENASAANLYTANPLGRFSRRGAVSTAAQDIPGMLAGQAMFGVPIPPMSLARIAGMPFRPSARTREGLARLLAARVNRTGGSGQPRATASGPSPVPPPQPVSAAPPVTNASASQPAVVQPPAAQPAPVPAAATPAPQATPAPPRAPAPTRAEGQQVRQDIQQAALSVARRFQARMSAMKSSADNLSPPPPPPPPPVPTDADIAVRRAQQQRAARDVRGQPAVQRLDAARQRYNQQKEIAEALHENGFRAEAGEARQRAYIEYDDAREQVILELADMGYSPEEISNISGLTAITAHTGERVIVGGNIMRQIQDIFARIGTGDVQSIGTDDLKRAFNVASVKRLAPHLESEIAAVLQQRANAMESAARRASAQLRNRRIGQGAALTGLLGATGLAGLGLHSASKAMFAPPEPQSPPPPMPPSFPPGVAPPPSLKPMR